MNTPSDDIIARIALAEDGIVLPPDGSWEDMLFFCEYFVEKVGEWTAEERDCWDKDTDYQCCPELGGVPIGNVNARLAPRVLAQFLEDKGE